MRTGDIHVGMARYCFECDDEIAQRIEGLATKYGLTEEKVLEQLVEVGLEEIEADAAQRT
jgi:predicted DNA-binding protein